MEGKIEDKRDNYEGRKVTIHDNRSICAHAGYCTDQLSSVFRMKQEPWIDPDAASVEDIVAVVNACPSGALSYSVDDAERSEQLGSAEILISQKGPYFVTGDVDLVDVTCGQGASKSNFVGVAGRRINLSAMDRIGITISKMTATELLT